MRYDDFNQTNQYLKQVATGQTSIPAKGSLWQIRIDPQTANVIGTEPLVEQACKLTPGCWRSLPSGIARGLSPKTSVRG